MMSRQQETSYHAEIIEEWADWSAWQGYEFWSAQLEAEMEFVSELQQAMGDAPLPATPEGQSDVLPF